MKRKMGINQNHIAIKFFNFTCSHDNISKEIDLEPTRIGIKGNEYFIGPEHNKIRKIWPYNFWEYRVLIEENTWISDLVDQFIDNIIKPRHDKIKNIMASCESEFSVVQYFYDGCNPGLHFDKQKLQIISSIGASLDIDIYCLSKAEEEINV
jgi:hypothetical protein